MSWVGQDMANTGGHRETMPDRRATGTHSVVLFFSLSSLLYSPYYLALLFFYNDLFLRDVQNIVQQQARRHRNGTDAVAMRDGTGPRPV